MTVRRKKSRKSARKCRSRKPARLKPRRRAKRKQPKRAAPRRSRASALAALPASVRAWLRRGRKATGQGPAVKTKVKPKVKAASKPKCPFCEEDHGLDGHPYERWDEYVEEKPVARPRHSRFVMPPTLRFRDEYPEEGDEL